MTMGSKIEPKEAESRRKKTELVLSNIYNLPSMSNVMLDLSRLLDDPSTNTTALSNMIGKDQGLATKILSIANSPLYGLPRKVSTIDFAILIIGYQDIKNIVIALSMIESFKNKNDGNLNQKEFWAHSIITGNAAKRIAEDLGYRIEGEAFVGGLLHDLAIPVMHKYFHSDFVKMLEQVRSGNKTYLEAEYELLGITHPEIAEFLCNKWNLPDDLREAVTYHHKPTETANNVELASIIHLADYMTQVLQIGDFYWDENFEFDKNVIDVLKFSGEEALQKFILQYKELFFLESKSLKV